MFNKKFLLTLSALACMAFASNSFAAEADGGLYRDINGDLHYKMCKAGQTLMRAEDMTSTGFWIVPPDVLAMKADPIPAHEVLGLTEEEFAEYSKGEGGNMPWKRNDVVIVPVHEILDITEEEYMEYGKGEGGKMPNRFIKPGDGYNPATWGYTPKAPITERIQKILNEK